MPWIKRNIAKHSCRLPALNWPSIEPVQVGDEWQCPVKECMKIWRVAWDGTRNQKFFERVRGSGA